MTGRGVRRAFPPVGAGERTSAVGRVPLLAALTVLVLLAGCSAVRIPADPDGTLDRVRGGVLRVGVSPHEPWTTLAGGEPGGVEPDLVRTWAAGLGARVEWRVGGEQPLTSALERGELDLVIGGITADTPWSSHAAVTRPFTTSQGPDGAQEHVMLAPMGENAFLVELESFLLTREPSA